MDKKLRFKGIFGDAPQASDEDYNTYDPEDPRNKTVYAVNEKLDQYVNPTLEKVVGKVNEYLPFEIPENINFSQISKGERQELNNWEDAANQIGGVSGGLKVIGAQGKALSPALQAIKESMEARLGKVMKQADEVPGKADAIKEIQASIDNLHVNQGPVKTPQGNIKVNQGSGRFGKIIVR